MLERLRDDRRDYCRSGSEQDERWTGACNTLLNLLKDMQRRHDLEKQDLATAMREFVQEFEHSTARIDQILHSEYAHRQGAPDPDIVFDWMDVVFRQSIYAILSTWIDDKTETRSVSIRIALATGETEEAWTHEPMTVPRKYRRATKRI